MLCRSQYVGCAGRKQRWQTSIHSPFLLLDPTLPRKAFSETATQAIGSKEGTLQHDLPRPLPESRKSQQKITPEDCSYAEAQLAGASTPLHLHLCTQQCSSALNPQAQATGGAGLGAGTTVGVFLYLPSFFCCQC